MNTGQAYQLGKTLAAKAEDRTARYLWQVWRTASMYRDNSPCGATTLRREIDLGYRQFHATDSEVVKAGNDQPLYVNHAMLKSTVVLAFLNKVGFDVSGLPFKIEPSPIPELTQTDQATAMNRAIMQLVSMTGQLTFGLQSPETLLTRMDSEDMVTKHEAYLEAAGVRDVLRQYVEVVTQGYRADMKEMAASRAARMGELIADQLKEGRFNASIEQFKLDCLISPYGAVEGPVPTVEMTTKWRNNKLVTEPRVVPRFSRVHPLDVAWSPDSKDTQNGTYMVVRKYFTRESLMDMSRAPDAGYFTQALIDILELIANLEDPSKTSKFFEYTSKHPLGIEATMYQVPNGGAVQGLTYYGKLSGYKLKELGYGLDSASKPLEDYLVYETDITVVAGRVIRAVIYQTPNTVPRPINTVSLKGKTYGMYGDSYIGGFRSLERAYNDKLLWEHTNDYATSVALYELDISRMTTEDAEQVAKKQREGKTFVFKPGTVVSASNEFMQGNGKQSVVTPHKLADPHPNRRLSLSAISSEIDRISGVPASMHGEASSSGMMRSFKTVFLLEGNASSILTNMASQIDKDLYAPIAHAMNIYNLLTSDDAAIKGDVNIIAEGVQGAVEKEVEAERVREDGMTIVQAMGMAQHISNPEIRAMVEAYSALGLKAMLETTGVDPEEARYLTQSVLASAEQAQMEAQQQEMAMAQGGQVQPQVAEGGAPPEAEANETQQEVM